MPDERQTLFQSDKLPCVELCAPQRTL